MFRNQEIYKPQKSQIQIPHDIEICQSDYPLDWYQEDFIPYALEYQSLKDRKLETIIKWMTPYLKNAYDHFGNNLLLLAHYYMGGEIVKLIEHFNGVIGDSYQLGIMAQKHPEKTVIIESAVHFMAETISILANPEQTVYITNPKSGCTMEMMAKDYMVQPAFQELNERYGSENILPVCYMNTSGRLKAMTGAQNGAVCTSSNVKKIFAWALAQNKKILFIPDRHMGENIAYWLNIKNIAYWPGGNEGLEFSLFNQNAETLKTFDNANLILFESGCSVHTYYTPEMCDYWNNHGFVTIVHPECRNETVKLAQHSGSTAFIWDYVINDRGNTRKYAIGTENHMVENLKQACIKKNIQVINLAEIPQHSENYNGGGCGCATMSRNDPPHLVALLDLLRQGKNMQYNAVAPGDVVNEFTGVRSRLKPTEQEYIKENALKALANMIHITEKL